MRIIWEVDAEDVRRLKQFIAQHGDNAFVRNRIANNLNAEKSPITKERFWEIMVGCLLTTQQRAGPESPVSRFISKRPFLLRYECCHNEADLETHVTRILSDFGGLRRWKKIGHEVSANSLFLNKGGWEQTSAMLERVRLEVTPETERVAARFIDTHFEGFGPKQSRNLLQGLGLSLYEVPIDSRITKWLNAFGFPVKLTSSGLSDREYFEFVSDGFQVLARAGGLMPCVLDAAIFSSFDGNGWTEENVVW